MSRRRDPVQRRDDGDADLHDVAEWEPRTVVDRVVYLVYATVRSGVGVVLATVALGLVLVQLALGDGTLLTDPLVVAFVALSAVPALALAAYVWYADVTAPAPPRLVAATFLLGLLFVGFAGFFNTVVGAPLVDLFDRYDVPATVTMAVVFVVVVGPVEETVKLLAVYLHPYQHPQFDTVLSGAVYGAAAGLGFATMENAFFITAGIADAGGPVATATESTTIATMRALAGPGHVIYSAFAGYYLGLARFNRRYAGPIVFKGLLVAVGLHATYNVLVSESALHVPGHLATATPLSEFAAIVAFVLAYVGVLTVVLLYKLSRYRAAYRAVHDDVDPASELTEFERDVDHGSQNDTGRRKP